MPDTFTSELEAVNVLLGTIGEAPINTLLGTLPSDVSMARDVLKEVRRKVCEQGWYFNTDYGVQSTLNPSNEIIVGTNWLRAETTYPAFGMRLVQRGQRMWNIDQHTYTVDSAPKLNVVYLLDWADLPEAARQYIMHRSARIFQNRSVGAPELEQAAGRDEMQALTELKRADSRLMNRNIFHSRALRTSNRFRRL